MTDKSKDASRGGSDGDAERVVIRDRRKIDPTGGGKRRAPEPEEGDVDADGKAGAHRAAESETSGLGAELAALRTELEERTRDLQRVTAEYANYRKRVDRDRGVAAEQTTGAVLSALLPV